MEDIHEILKPCDNIEKTCKNLLLHSFAIIRVDSETWTALNSAWLASKQFFAQAYHASSQEQEEIEMSMITKYRKIKNLNLLGFNRPNPQKLLFRVMFSNGLVPDSMQPWPDDIDEGALKESSLRLMPRLHDLLCAFLGEIKRQVAENDEQHDDNDDIIYGDQDQQQQEEEPKHKKYKRGQEYYIDKEGTNGGPLDLSSCPLDYFYYHSSIKNEPVENCSEHVDRGILICISLTNVAGLEVLSRLDGIWHCPEMVSICEGHYSDNQSGCSDLVCILSGDQLKKAVLGLKTTAAATASSSNKKERTFPGLNACVHRVRRKLAACRLSITYELRHR